MFTSCRLSGVAGCVNDGRVLPEAVGRKSNCLNNDIKKRQLRWLAYQRPAPQPRPAPVCHPLLLCRVPASSEQSAEQMC